MAVSDALLAQLASIRISTAHRILKRIGQGRDQAKTPLDRLCACGVLPQHLQQERENLRNRTNPRQLRREIGQLIARNFSLPGATPGISADVYDTLLSTTSQTKDSII